MDGEADQEVLGARLAAVRAEIASLAARLRSLREDERALSYALARLSANPTSPSAEVADTEAMRSRRITPQVRAILRESQGPVDRHVIVQRLRVSGYDTSVDAVSASLSYLQRTGVAINLGGVWEITADPDTT